MRTLETDAEIGQDGSVKLLSPLPDWLRPGKAHMWILLDCAKDSGVTPRAGSLKGFRMSPDFDEPMEDFKEYME